MEHSERERLHSGTNVSHSTLVNSGNAAIIGHTNNLNGLKLNSNNNNFTSINPAQVNAYGAIGNNPN